MLTELTFPVPETAGDVAALLLCPDDARWLLVLAHGAGAGMRHAFMEGLAHELGTVGIATFRYQFPYMQHRRGRPDSPAVLTATVRSAIQTAAQAAPVLPLLVGGKSLGGRISSHVLSEALGATATEFVLRVRGLVFFGFPLHAPGRPSTKRAAHLVRVKVPMLFLQGTRDTLADLVFLRPVCAELAPRATLHVIDTADHSFHVQKRSGTTDADVLRELAQTTAVWANSMADRHV